jgi:hypothetical protein
MSGLLLTVLVLALTGVVAVVWVAGRQGLSHQERRELVRLKELVTNLREIAHEHRELDSNLAVIILDEIKNSERKDLGR